MLFTFIFGIDLYKVLIVKTYNSIRKLKVLCQMGDVFDLLVKMIYLLSCFYSRTFCIGYFLKWL